MSVWMAAIDESGTHGESSNIVVAAVLASVKAWGELAPKWEAVLKGYGLSYSHAYDLNGGKGECAKLTTEQRVECAKSLIRVASDYSLEYIAFAVERKLFESKNTDLGVYDYLLASTISDLVLKGEGYGIEQMYVFIEKGCKLSCGVSNILIRTAPSRKYLGPVGCIDLKEKIWPPMQVADMVAYETFKTNHNRLLSPEKPLRKSFQKIIEGNPFNHFLISNEWLDYDLPKVQKFLADISRT